MPTWVGVVIVLLTAILSGAALGKSEISETFSEWSRYSSLVNMIVGSAGTDFGALKYQFGFDPSDKDETASLLVKATQFQDRMNARHSELLKKHICSRDLEYVGDAYNEAREIYIKSYVVEFHNTFEREKAVFRLEEVSDSIYKFFGPANYQKLEFTKEESKDLWHLTCS